MKRARSAFDDTDRSAALALASNPDAASASAELVHELAAVREQLAHHQETAVRDKLEISELTTAREKLAHQLTFLYDEEQALRARLRDRTEKLVSELADAKATTRAAEDRAAAAAAAAAAAEGSAASSDPLRRQSAQVRADGAARLEAENARLRELADAATERAARAGEEADAARSEARLARREAAGAAALLSPTRHAADGALSAASALELRGELRTAEARARLAQAQAAAAETERRRAAILEEQVRDLKLKLAAAAKVSVRVGQLEAEVDAGLEAAARWDAEFRPLVPAPPAGGEHTPPPAPVTAEAAARLLRAARAEAVDLITARGDVERSRAAAERALTEAKRGEQAALAQAAAAKAGAEAALAEAAAASRQAALLAREGKGLKSLLATYEAEGKSQGRPADAATLALRDARVAALERALGECREALAGADGTRNKAAPPAKKAPAAPARRSGLVGAGYDFDPAATRVLHLVRNPTAEAAAKKAAEVAEAAAAAAEAASSSGSTAAAASAAVRSALKAVRTPAPRGMATPQQQQRGGLGPQQPPPTDSDKYNTRLKDMFREHIALFREAVYLLTGFKVDMITAAGPNPKFRLRSMYAPSEADTLLFQFGEGSRQLELLDTPFATTLDSKILVYLRQCNSIPAFLSNITLNLFESSTLM